MKGNYFHFEVNGQVFKGRKQLCEFLEINIYRYEQITRSAKFKNKGKFTYNGYEIHYNLRERIQEHLIHEVKPILYNDLVLLVAGDELRFTYSKERFMQLNPEHQFDNVIQYS